MTDTLALELKAALAVTDAGAITGVAWPFGTPDRVGDMIRPGAFKDAAAPVPMLWAHDPSEVIGVWEAIAETAQGLEVEGKLLVADVARAAEVRAMIRAGAATGLSIGFRTVAAQPRGQGRTITALELHEISVVAVPCHPGALITSTKAADGTASQPLKDPSPMEPDTIDPAAPAADTKALEAIKARLDRIEAKANRPGTAATIPADDTLEAKAFARFVRRGVERMAAEEAKALTISNDAAGGFLALEEFGAELIKLLIQHSPIRQFARVVTIGAPEVKYPRRVNGTGATWVAETAPRSASEPTFEQITLTPYELATFTDVSNQLLEDNAYGLEAELLADYAEAFGKTEGQAFVNGDGVGKPRGIMAAAGIASLNSGVAADITANSLIAAFHTIPQAHAQNAVWLMNRTTLSRMRTLADSTGRHLFVDPLSATAPSTLLGRPVVEMVDMPNVAAGAFPILFGDLQGYRITDRVGLSVIRDPYTQATVGQVRFHARKRVGGDLTHPDRFVKLRCAA